MTPPPTATIAEHREVQNAAKTVLANLAFSISASDTEATIAAAAHQALCNLGFPDTWYYDCPAFVLAGSRSCLSISGKDYVPSVEPVGEFNLVTVDLSPQRDGRWGDCARSFYVENGRALSDPAAPEFVVGKNFLEGLHAEMQAIVRPTLTFQDLYEWSNSRIATSGFQNLDFLGNVGHSIAPCREDRQYIEATNYNQLGDVPFFTFEPHVREIGGRWGFKHENIFYFTLSGRIETL